MRIPLKNNDQQGFTIVELMIATSVLSVILLLTTVMITSIGNLYYKGINQSRIQDTVRTLTDDVSQNLQLTSTSPQSVNQIHNGRGTSVVIYAYCLGTTRYSYVLGRQLGTDTAVYHVLWRDTIANGSCVAADLTQSNLSTSTSGTNGVELISSGSRLTGFSISGASPTYSISVGAAYGDDDLICSPDVPNSCSGSVQLTPGDYSYTNPITTILCKGSVGDKFCATASLDTTATQRIGG